MKFDEDFRGHFIESLNHAVILIREQNDYAAGFEAFATTLDQFEKTSAKYVNDPRTQKQLRVAVKVLWDVFVGETKDREKMSRRMREFKPTEDEIQKAVEGSRDQQTGERPSRSDLEKYFTALRQQQEGSGNVAFINSEAQSAHLETVGRQIISDYLDSVASPVVQAYEKDRQQIFYIGALYNHALPNTMKVVQGMAQQLFPEKSKLRQVLLSPEVKRIPVTAETIRTEIVNFLAFADRQAHELAKLGLERDAVRGKRDLK